MKTPALRILRIAAVGFGLSAALLARPKAEEPPPSTDFASPIRAELEAGRAGVARRRALEWVRTAKKSPEPWTWLGRAYLAEGRPRAAARAFARALKRSPHHGAAYYGRGQVFERRGRLDEAANEYRAAVLAEPGFREAEEALVRLKAQSSTPE